MAIAQPPSVLDTDEQLVRVSEFSSRLDNQPRAAMLTWQQFADRLTTHVVRRQKDGPGWSPTVYREGATRSKKGVEYVTALALDFDHCEPPRELLEGLAWVGHTTFRHVADDPRWRVVVRLAQPVRGEDWPEVWKRAQHYFGATADEQCKDCSRFFYLPAAKPGAECLTERHDGQSLDIDDLPAVPEPPRLIRPAAGRARPGQSRYAAAALEAELSILAATSEGQRNGQLNTSVFSIAQLVATGHLVQAEVEQAFESVALQIGLTETETRRTIESAMEAGLREPREVPAPAPPLSVPPRTNGKAHHVDVIDAVPLIRQEHDEPPTDGPPPEPKQADVGRPDFHLTDLGNAQRLVASHGEDLRYCFQVNRWFIWDGRRWADDSTAEIERRAKRTVRGLYAQAASDDLDEDKSKALVKHAFKSESHKAIGAMVALARSESGVPVTMDDLDRYPWLLNVENGTLDLRTGDLRPHRRQNLLTKLVPVAYHPDATCPIWIAFLERIMAGNEHLIDFLRRAIGYSLTGSARERVLLLLHGGGSNGKSTLIETIAALLGDYAKSTRAETLMVKTYDTAIPNDIAALKGARFVSTSETEEGKRLAEALVKSLTGGDSISARFLRGEYFTFRATFKLWLATNHRPTIRGTDRAIWDRIRLVPFDVRIPDAEQDKELPTKLAAELPGILAWAVRGCLEWQRNGLGVPAEVTAATDNYRAEMDVLANFMDDRCVIAEGARASASKLWKEYQEWCQETGEHAGKQKTFGMRLEEKGFQPGRSKTERFWTGIGLAGQEVQTSLNASSGDAFSNSVTRGDANPGINELYTPHVALSRETRHNASPGQNASPGSDDDQVVEVEL